MEWQAPAIVLSARPHGEAGAVVSVLTEAHGRHAGLARGGASRAQVSLWQPGNLLEARWVGRLPEQLGSLSAELVHPSAALALDDPWALALLSAACAMAESTLPERVAHPVAFHGLVSLLGRLGGGAMPLLPDYVRWEVALLEEMGWGLNLTECALTGATEDLAWVSPRTGRAVSAAAAGPWRDRLLPLPRFLLAEDRAGANDPSGPADWLAGLRLTGHFLHREAGRDQLRALPPARQMLMDRLTTLAADSVLEDG
jgi:DNA repair protein RecO (recombination protein O)